MNKYSIILIATLGIIGTALFAYFHDNGKVEENTNAPVATLSTSSSPANAEAKVITYTNTGFSPNTIHVKVGDTVTFINDSSVDMWPASNPHPVHTEYPVSGGCIGSTFDACKAVAPGESWQFTFSAVGNWGYHNHKNPVDLGTVIVEN